jgi:hypothetical protein
LLQNSPQEKTKMDHKLNKLLSSAAKTIEGQDKLWCSVLVRRAEELVDRYPHDPTCVGMYRFLEERAKKQPLISKADFRSAYQSLYSRSNMFGDVFQNELGGLNLQSAKIAQHEANENKPFQTGVNEDLLATVAGLFSQTPQLLSEGTVGAAEAVTLRGMNRFSYKPTSVTSLASDECGVVCTVAYDTPKGIVNVVVPVEVEVGVGVLSPTVFISEAGFTDLNEENLTRFLQVSAGKRYSIDPKLILRTIKVAKKGMVDPVSKEFESIVARARMGTDTSNANDIVGLKVMDADPVDEVLFPEETKSFADRLGTVAGEAGYLFGDKLIAATQSGLIGKLKSWGFSHPKVSVANFNADGIIFAANIDNLAGFTVSATVKDGLCKVAEVVISDGNVFDFNASGLNEMMALNVDVGAVAAASGVQHLGPSGLLETVIAAVQDGNMPRAEEALMTLQAQGEEKAYLEGFKVYMAGMNQSPTVKTASAEPQHTCSMIRKTAGSKYQVCGHTGLPLHKVFQNQQGECLPLYRKSQEEPGSAHILQHKIAWT